MKKLQFDRRPAVSKRTGSSRSKLYADISRGLFVPPIKRGPKTALWPSHEVDQIIAAEIRGATEDELRELVTKLTEMRANFSVNTLAHAE